MQYFPLFADLRERPCLIVGGGDVASRKLRLLLAAGARVTVLAPELGAGTRALLGTATSARHVRQRFSPTAVAGHALVIAATNDPAVNRAVHKAGEAVGVLVNSVDDPANSSFIVPAIVDRSPLMVAVSSAGAAPVLARRIRQWLEAVLPDGLGRLAALAGSLRGRVKARLGSVGQRRMFWERQLNGDFARLALSGEPQRAIRLFDRALEKAAESPSDTGRVSLVGAGPGDPGLLTLRAMQRLGEADIVLHDRLVGADILALARRDADFVPVGKRAGGGGCRQESIHEQMVSLALRGLRVVRLKGGDPFVFGRGGEELEALRRAGVECEVIPGITAAVGCAAAIGLPLTHRDLAQSLIFVTAHRREELEDLDWQLLGSAGQTVAVYMGVGRAGDIEARLVSAGRDPATPVAVVQDGTTPRQRVVVGTLGDLAALVEREDVGSPALIYIGETVGLLAVGAESAAGSRDLPEVWSPLALAG